MLDLTAHLEQEQAVLLEHHYHPTSFGSWWLSFEKQGNAYRLVFDGREFWLNLQSQDVKSGEWLDLEILPLEATTPDKVLQQAIGVISTLT